MSGELAARMSMRGRRAVITGAAGHLGRVIAETLIELGAHVILVDRDAAALDAAAAAMPHVADTSIETFTCDLEADAARQALIATLSAHEAGVSVLVNNAAFVGTSGLAGCPFVSRRS